MGKTEDNVVKKVTDSVTKDLPKLVKENKGAAIGAVVGYLLADKLQENEGLITAVLGGLVGKAVDDKKKEKEF
jgi:uncharacterized protein YcfJ